MFEQFKVIKEKLNIYYLILSKSGNPVQINNHIRRDENWAEIEKQFEVAARKYFSTFYTDVSFLYWEFKVSFFNFILSYIPFTSLYNTKIALAQDLIAIEEKLISIIECENKIPDINWPTDKSWFLESKIYKTITGINQISKQRQDMKWSDVEHIDTPVEFDQSKLVGGDGHENTRSESNSNTPRLSM